ncbi:MAG: TRAP transporter small permease subunit [Rhodospirillaceae bacterium]|nr:TRAP transporter small permease subunit [Rhodospirillaceae bacterium]
MRAISLIIACLGAAGLVFATALTLLDVALRYWGAPVDALSELAVLIVTCATASFFPITLREDRNLSIRYLGAAIGPRTARALNLLGALATFAFFAVVAWRFGLYAADTLSSGETTAMAGMRIYPTWIYVAAVFVVALPVQVLTILRLLRRPADGTEADDAHAAT